MSLRIDGWNIPSDAVQVSPQIITKYRIGPLLARVLASRGYSSDEQISAVLGVGAPSYDPLTMADMQKAVDEIRNAISTGTKITIFGDYDVDGLTSTYILYDWLKGNNADVQVHIPEREGEGYGINRSAIERIAEKGTGMIITVDNGINAVEEAEYARELGITMVITDHHTPGDVLPSCAAVVDPHRLDCPYPNKSLAGVGVAFKLIVALEGNCETQVMRRYGDMLALGTIADVCDVTGENHRMLTFAERVLKKTANPGLRELAKRASCPVPALSDISFRLAPRLNAAGRVGSPLDAFKLLCSRDEAEAEYYAEQLCDLNTKRQVLENDIYCDAEELILNENPEISHALIIRNDNWKLGVLGIVAARVAEKYSMPAVLLSSENGILRGSARSGGNFDVFEALKSASEGIATCGGHRQAAGVKVPPENFEEFKRRFYAITAEKVPASGLSSSLETDGVVPVSAVTIENIFELERMAPFGTGNLPPLLCVEDVNVDGIYPVGDGKHTRMVLSYGRYTLTAVWFGCAVTDCGVSVGEIIDVAFSPEINEFRGIKNPRATVRAVRKSADRAVSQLKELISGKQTYITVPPSRDECAAVWNEIRQFPVFTVNELIVRLRRKMPVSSLAAVSALEAFRQSGLIELSADIASADDTVTVTFCKRGDEKVKLEETEIYRVYSADRG